MDFHSFVASLDLYRRVKHGFWLFCACAIGVAIALAFLDSDLFVRREARVALSLAPAAAFALGAAFPLGLLRRRVAASLSAALACWGLCGWVLASYVAATQPWAGAIALGALAAGAAWGAACHGVARSKAQPSVAFLRVASAEPDFEDRLVEQAQLFGQSLGGRPWLVPFGAGTVARFNRLEEFWIVIEPDPSQTEIDSDSVVEADPWTSHDFLATLVWQPIFSIRKIFGAPRAPMDIALARDQFESWLGANLPGCVAEPLG